MAIKVANNQSLTAITALPSAVSGGAMTLISTQTASSSSAISFTSNIDDTYDEYVFKFYDIHPATDGAEFTIGFRDGGSAYDATKTTTFFAAYHAEADDSAGISYYDSLDMAQGTGGANIFYNVGNGNDESASGTLHLFNPSSTTFVKHFISTFNVYNNGDNSVQVNASGYADVTAAIDGVQFAMSSGNIDSGVIKLYGIS